MASFSNREELLDLLLNNVQETISNIILLNVQDTQEVQDDDFKKYAVNELTKLDKNITTYRNLYPLEQV
jgi:hypothetical protein